MTAATAPSRVTKVHDRASDQPWEAFGDFLGAVIRAGHPHAAIDPRLTRAATGASIETGSDGGFMIPPSFATIIESKAAELGQVWSKVRKVPITGNTATIAGVDESSRANGSRWGGVVVGRLGEADQFTGSKPKFHQVALKLKKLGGIMYLSEEMLEDSGAIAAVGTDAFAEELVFVSEDECFNGYGAGQMLGIMRSPALITVDKVAAQAANTVVAQNVIDMKARLPVRSRRTAAWYIDQTVEAQLPSMTIGNQPVYLPQGSLRGSPDFDTLLGLPVIPTEYQSTLGTVGDIVLADFNQYVAIEKAGRVAQSMHVRFLYDEQVLKFVTRNDGAPLWKSPLTPKNGGATRSPFIALQTRA